MIYIDGDTLILKDLYELYNVNLNDKYAAVVKDFKVSNKYATKFFKELEKKNNGYFNSGMMVLNLKKIRDEKLNDVLIQYRMYGVNYFADQDALNVCFGGKVLYVDLKYNYLSAYTIYDQKEVCDFYKRDIIKDNDMVIYHYAGLKKPWNSDEPEEKQPVYNKMWKKYLNEG